MDRAGRALSEQIEYIYIEKDSLCFRAFDLCSYLGYQLLLFRSQITIEHLILLLPSLVHDYPMTESGTLPCQSPH
jgi:hypothetical protein